MARDNDPRVQKAIQNENSGPAARRQVAIAARGAKTELRRGGSGRTQRELGHVKGNRGK